ncbi:MAG: hypothetical protein NTV05_11615 [Acidobacteria bacterium]|nr:hypothetical protein [Acidobacteriota bacterium]
MLRLFDSAVSLRTEFIGRATGYAPDWLYAAANRLGGAWSDHIFGLCPNCGVTARAVRPNVFGYVLQRLIWRAEARAKPGPAWVLMLFRVRE